MKKVTVYDASFLLAKGLKKAMVAVKVGTVYTYYTVSQAAKDVKNGVKHGLES